MNITITDEEKEDLKKRIIATAEERLTSDLISQMRRDVTRELANKLYRDARVELEKLLLTPTIQDRVMAAVDKEIEHLSTSSNRGWEKNKIKEALENAVMRVSTAHAEAVSKELTTLLYTTLKAGFYRPDEESR